MHKINGYEPCEVCNPYNLAKPTSSNSNSFLNSSTQGFIASVAGLFIFWLFCNTIASNLFQDSEDMLADDNPVVEILKRISPTAMYIDYIIDTIISCRKTIMFNIGVMIFLYIVNVDFLIWIALIYFIITGAFLACMLVIYIGTAIDIYLKEHENVYQLWLMNLALFLATGSIVISFMTVRNFL